MSTGLLRYSDIHRLFDTGYVGVTPEYKFVVSARNARIGIMNGRFGHRERLDRHREQAFRPS